jgi:hypothetical protein
MWLLWIGGIPFVAAFVFFVIVSLRTLQPVAQERTDAVGVAATSAFSYLVAIIVMMLFDPHLTLRGSADLFFPLLALSLVDSGAGVRRPRLSDLGPGAVGTHSNQASGFRRDEALHERF